jgi:luciferase family oxidoreductase group 1
MSGPKLSALYLQGSPGATFSLPPALEALGYQRFWIAENQPQPSPILSAALVAGVTDSIRVGTAGVLAQFYAPFALAQDFRFLERVFSGRIDLGFCSSWIGATDILEAMLDGRDPERHRAEYSRRMADLVQHVRQPQLADTEDQPDEAAATEEEDDDGAPALWSMGTGAGSALLAGQHGLCFAYSVFHSMSDDDPSIVQRYRDAFRPCAAQPKPEVVVATAGVCAETDDEAHELAARWPNPQHLPRVVGSPETCSDALAELRHRYDVDEIVFADLIVAPERRLPCYRMLAETAARQA